MVWNDAMLIASAAADGLVTPFDHELVNPASIDLRLGDTIRRAHPGWKTQTKKFANGLMALSTLESLPLWSEPYKFDEVVIMPGEFVLCHSLEYVRIPVTASALLFSKSSMGRVGLEHSHAGLGDPGFEGQWTWEWSNIAPWPIKIVAGKRYMQMQLYDLCDAPIRHYGDTGRYQGQTGPTMAREAK